MKEIVYEFLIIHGFRFNPTIRHFPSRKELTSWLEVSTISQFLVEKDDLELIMVLLLFLHTCEIIF